MATDYGAGSTNTSRAHDVTLTPGISVPNGAHFVLAALRMPTGRLSVATGHADYNYFFSTGAFNANDSLNLYIGGDSNGADANDFIVRFENIGGNGGIAVTDIDNDTWWIVNFQRRANLKCTMKVMAFGESAWRAGEYDANTEAFPGFSFAGGLRLGGRIVSPTSRWYNGQAAFMLMGTGVLDEAHAAAIAAGGDPADYTATYSYNAHFDLTDPDAVVDLVSGRTVTKVGTGHGQVSSPWDAVTEVDGELAAPAHHGRGGLTGSVAASGLMVGAAHHARGRLQGNVTGNVTGLLRARAHHGQAQAAGELLASGALDGAGHHGTATFEAEVAALTLAARQSGDNLNPAATVITDGGTLTPAVTLVAYTTNGASQPANSWWFVQGTFNQALGKTPTFTLANTNAAKGLSAFLMVWSDDGKPVSDRTKTWARFDNANFSGGVLTFSNDDPCAGDDLVVAYARPYVWGLLDDYLDGDWSASPFVYELASAVTFGGNTHDIATFAGYTDDNGVVVGAQTQRAFGLTDAANVPLDGEGKRSAMLISGMHSPEDAGTEIWVELVKLLLSANAAGSSDEQRYAALLRNFDFWCSGWVSPGREVHHNRGLSDTGGTASDPNRAWDSPGELDFVDAVRTAFESDRASTALVALDFHAQGNGTAEDVTLNPASSESVAWRAGVAGYRAGIGTGSFSAAGSTQEYATLSYGAIIAATIERSEASSAFTVADSQALARAALLSLADEWDLGVFAPALAITSGAADHFYADNASNVAPLVDGFAGTFGGAVVPNVRITDALLAEVMPWQAATDDGGGVWSASFANVPSSDLAYYLEVRAGTDNDTKIVGADKFYVGVNVSGAVRLDADGDGAERAGPLQGVSDSKSMTFSAFVKVQALTQFGYLFIGNTAGAGGVGRVEVRISAAGDVRVRARQAGGGVNDFTFEQEHATQLVIGQWSWIGLSFDAATAESHFYIDATPDATGITINNIDADFTHDQWFLGHQNMVNGIDAEVAKLWCQFGVFTDLSDSATREGFYDGAAVDVGVDGALATGARPDVYLDGDADQFFVNRGTGGLFDATGTPATVDAPPAALASGTLSARAHHGQAQLAGQLVASGVLAARGHHARAALDGDLLAAGVLAGDGHHGRGAFEGAVSDVISAVLVARGHHGVAEFDAAAELNAAITARAHHGTGLLIANLTGALNGVVRGRAQHGRAALAGGVLVSATLTAAAHHGRGQFSAAAVAARVGQVVARAHHGQAQLAGALQAGGVVVARAHHARAAWLQSVLEVTKPRYLKQLEASFRRWDSCIIGGQPFPCMYNEEYVESLGQQGVSRTIELPAHMANGGSHSVVAAAVVRRDVVETVVTWKGDSLGPFVIETIQPSIEGTWVLRLRNPQS